MMTDEVLVGQLVKSRERCRQLVQLYQGAYDEFMNLGVLSVSMEKAVMMVSHLLAHLRAISGGGLRQVQSPEQRKEAEALLEETGDLLQRVMVIERELRESSQAMWTRKSSVSIS